MSAQKDFKFDKRASKYDDGVEGKVSGRFYRLLLDQVKLFPGAAVLDVGCGTGTMLRKMADTCIIDGYGIDMTENMITQAKNKCPEMKLQISRCESTPFNSQTFDVIIACMAYHHFSDQSGFAKEAARIIKPGGKLYIADPRLPCIIRKPLNGAFRIARVAAYFETAQEIAEGFREYGFEFEDAAYDRYAQVVKLSKK